MSYDSLSVADLDRTILRRWHDKGIVFLIGSYVSVFPPTNLPFGWATSQALWKKILRPSDPDFLKNDLDAVPFEAMMQCYPDKPAIRRIIQALFSARAPNPIHRCFASALNLGKTLGLITTNYDLALDCALQEVGQHAIVFDKASFDRFGSLAPDPVERQKVCFKIHGTAAPGAESTIVCDLNAEGWLPDWKRKLLLNITSDRTLVIVGYSGSDFDICPELANSTKQAHTVWLQYHPSQIRPNAARVLHARHGTAVIGDLVPFLNALLGENLTLAPPTPQPFNLDLFNPKLMPEWRVRILNWIACPRLLPNTLVACNHDSQLFVAVCGHTGRYHDAIKEMERVLRSRSLKGEDNLRQKIQLISSRFIYGQHLRAWMALNRVDTEIATLRPASDDLRVFATETRLMMLMRAAQIARALHMGPLLKTIQKTASHLYQDARHFLQTAGAWGRLEALQQNAERIGIATSDGLPLPSRRGYQSLGLVSMYLITKRDWLRSGNWRLTEEKQDEAWKCLSKAEAYGWNHEAWKISWILFCRGTGSKLGCFSSFWKYFWQTQYPFLSRFFQLFINLVPTGSEHKFEDQGYWN